MDKSTEQLIIKSQKLLSGLKQEREDGVSGFLKDLKEKTTPKDRIIYIHEKLSSMNMLQQKYKKDHKSDSATKYKEKGDKFFVMGQYSKALKSYTKSLMRAKEQKLLATVYANRSAALLKLGLYRECLTDIERAFINDYDEHLRPQLIDRRRKVTELLLASKVEKFHEDMPEFPTNKIEIQTCRTGHKVVATETIEVGDTFAIEEPLVSIISENYLNHCHECFELCYNPIPCDGCTQTLYCNQTCKRKAFVSYHRHECPILKSVNKLMGKTFPLALAVKMFFQYGKQLSDDIFRLIKEAQNKKFANQMEIEVIAAVMYELVKNYTKQFSGPNGQATEKSFQDNIVALLQVSMLQYSGAAELCYNDDGMFNKQDILAFSIYAFYGNIRHSCAPNAFPHHYGVKRVWRAFRTIEKGKEVLITYGPYYGQQPREMRQDILHQQYHFRCTCLACRENWDQLDLHSRVFVSSDDSRLLSQMKGKPDVVVVKSKVTEKIQKIKSLEEWEPNIGLTVQQRLLLYYYSILGNKRLV